MSNFPQSPTSLPFFSRAISWWQSIRFRLPLFLIMTMLTVAGLSTFANSRIISNQGQQLIYNKLSSVAEVSSSQIESDFEEEYRLLTTIATNPLLIEWVEGHNRALLDNGRGDLTARLRDQEAEWPSFLARNPDPLTLEEDSFNIADGTAYLLNEIGSTGGQVILVNQFGALAGATAWPDRYVFSETPWFEALSTGTQPFLGVSAAGETPDQMTVTIGRVIQNGDGETVGFLLKSFNYRPFSEQFESNLVGVSGATAVAQEDGEMLLSTIDGSAFGDQLLANPAYDGLEIMIPKGGNGNAFLAASNPIDTTLFGGLDPPIYVMAIEPQAAAMAPVNAARFQTIAIALIFTLAVVYLFYRFYIQKLVEDLTELRRQAEAIPIAFQPVKADIAARGDELGVLGDAFNRMAEQIERQVSEQEQIIAKRTTSLRNQAAQLETALYISRVANSSLDLNDLIRAVTITLQEEFGHNDVSLFLLNAQQSGADLRAATSAIGQKLVSRGYFLPLTDSSPVGRCLAHGKMQLEKDRDAGTQSEVEHVLPDTRSELALPLKAKGKLLGAFHLQNSDPRPFSMGEIDILQLIADQVAAALENARLYNTLEYRAYRQRKVLEIWRDISSLNTPEKIFQALCDHLVNTFQMDGAYLMRLEDRQLVIRHSVGLTAGQRPVNIQRPHAYGPWGTALTSASPTLFTAAETAGDLRHDLELPPLNSEAIAPLIVHGRPIGLIGACRTGSLALDISDLNLLALLTEAAIATLDNVQLLANREENLRELQRLYEQTTKPDSFFKQTEEFVYKSESLDAEKVDEYVLPLMLRDKPIGAVIISETAATGSRELAETITHQAGYALENSQLFAQTRVRLAEQENLRIQLQTAAELAADLGSLLDKDTLLQKTIDLMQERFELYYVGIFLVNETQTFAQLHSGTGEAGAEQIAQGHRHKVGSRSLIGGAVADGQPRVHQDVLQAEDWYANPLLPDTRSEIALPLRARGRILGAVTAQSVETGKFNAALIRIMQTMCDQIAIALDNSALFGQLENQIRNTDRLNQAEHRLIEADNKESVLQTVHDFAVESDLFDTISLVAPVSLASARDDLQIVPAEGSHGAVIPQRFVNLEHDIILTRQEINAQEDSELVTWLTHTNLEQLLLVPLTINQEWLGTVILGLNEVNTQPDLITAPIKALARQAASVLANLELLRETNALYDLSRALSQAISQEHVARITVEEIVRYTQVDQCRVFLLDEKENNELYIAASHQPIADELVSFYVNDDPLLNYLRENREMLLINRDDPHSPTEIVEKYLLPYGLETMLAIPAYSLFKLIGFITLDSLKPNWKPGGVQHRFARTAAEQFIITFENMVLFDEALKRAQELVAINQIGARIASTLDESEIAAIVQSDLRPLIHHDLFLMGQLKDNKVIPLLFTERGHKKPIEPLPISQQVGAWLSQSDDILKIKRTDNEFGQLCDAFNLQARSLHHLLLSAFGKESGQRGFILLGTAGFDAFAPEEVQLLRAVTNQTALGLSNARLLRETQENVAELRSLFNVTQAVASSVSADDRIANTVRTLHYSLRQAHIGIVLIEAGDLVSLISAVGELPILPDYKTELPPQLAKRLFLQNQPYWFDETTETGDFPNRFYPDCQSEIALPLSIGKQSIGFLTAGHPTEKRFSERDLRVLQTVCISLAAAIENGRLFDQIQAANEKLQELDKMKTQFLANMSHELRTPLNSIIGFSRLILKGIDGPITEAQDEDLSSIYNSGLHLLNLINNILDLAKLDAGKMTLVIEELDLNQLSESVLATARGLVQDKPIKLSWDVDPDLPFIEGDQTRLRQILLNLISNAAKFTEKGEVSCRISTLASSIHRPADFIQITVEDTGIGIAEKDFPQLFAKFEQIDASPTRAISGTGLGLPIVNELVQLHNGRIWVESEIGKGSKFHVLLPIKYISEQRFAKRQTQPLNPSMLPPEELFAAEQNGANGQNGHAGQGVEHSPHAAGGSTDEPDYETEFSPAILLVDDEPGILTLYQRYLSHLPNEIVTARNGGEALAKLIERPAEFGLVLLDIHMPEASGWDVLHEIRSFPELESLPVIVCSVDITQTEAEMYGAQLALTKPIISDDLTKVLELMKRNL